MYFVGITSISKTSEFDFDLQKPLLHFQRAILSGSYFSVKQWKSHISWWMMGFYFRKPCPDVSCCSGCQGSSVFSKKGVVENYEGWGNSSKNETRLPTLHEILAFNFNIIHVKPALNFRIIFFFPIYKENYKKRNSLQKMLMSPVW